jgi:prophage antirepressor-like protein
MQHQFNELQLTVHETRDNKQWYMTVEEVAKGYGVAPSTIRTHLKDHADEIREGVERSAVGITNTRSKGGATQTREQTVIYREGVIKLGFFIRSKQAAHFRQWATNLVVQHMDQQGYTIQSVLEKLSAHDERFDKIEQVCTGLRDEVDDLKAIVGIMLTDTEEAQIRKLIVEVKATLNMDGRAIVGHVRKTLNLASVYNSSCSRLIVNTLNNMLGRGVRAVENPPPEQSI